MRLYAILLFGMLTVCSCKRVVFYDTSPPVYRVGDDPAWSIKHADLNRWIKQRKPIGENIYWCRINATITRRLQPEGPLGIKVTAFGAYELYWDGVMVGRNGRLASAQSKEIPGAETRRFMVPAPLAGIGQHVAAFRASQTHHPNDLRDIEIDLQNYEPMLRDPLLIGMMTHLLAGIFLITSLYYFSLYFTCKQRELGTLVFGVSCFLFFILLILEYLTEYIMIPYNFYFTRLYAASAVTFAISFIIPYYFTLRFRFVHSRWLLAILFLSLLSITLSSYSNSYLMNHRFSYIMWITSVLIVVRAVYYRASGAKVVLAGLLLSALVNVLVLYDIGLFTSYAIIAASMLYLHTIQMKELEEAHQTAHQLSSRLKLELLKKHIQPHFIKNTLTSLIDWVEHSPKDGALFLHALAKEFDILNRMAEETLVSIETEIELCRTHLQVMGFRKEVKYAWEQSNIDLADTLPPAILHTMVENGITHSMPNADNSITFRLTGMSDKTMREYQLLIIAQNRQNSRSDGTGFKYITSRLTESYGSQWTFSSGAAPDGWLNTIKIFAA